MDELIGRADLLRTNDAILTWKAKGLDFQNFMLENIDRSRKHTTARIHALSKALDNDLISEVLSAINNKTKNIEIKKPVKNINRTVGAMLSGYLARKFGKSLF